MVTKDYYAEIHGFSDKINTLTPFWSYNTLLNKISSLMEKYNIREENHISTYLPDDKDAGLGRTASGLPIKHYALGNGLKHVLVLGGERGNDIINSQAVYFLISYLAQKISNESLDNLLARYTFDFVPVLNPEGYIITTSAIDYFIRSSTQNKFDIESADSVYLVDNSGEDLTISHSGVANGDITLKSGKGTLVLLCRKRHRRDLWGECTAI